MSNTFITQNDLQNRLSKILDTRYDNNPEIVDAEVSDDTDDDSSLGGYESSVYVPDKTRFDELWDDVKNYVSVGMRLGQKVEAPQGEYADAEKELNERFLKVSQQRGEAQKGWMESGGNPDEFKIAWETGQIDKDLRTEEAGLAQDIERVRNLNETHKTIMSKQIEPDWFNEIKNDFESSEDYKNYWRSTYMAQRPTELRQLVEEKTATPQHITSEVYDSTFFNNWLKGQEKYYNQSLLKASQDRGELRRGWIESGGNPDEFNNLWLSGQLDSTARMNEARAEQKLQMISGFPKARASLAVGEALAPIVFAMNMTFSVPSETAMRTISGTKDADELFEKFGVKNGYLRATAATTIDTLNHPMVYVPAMKALSAMIRSNPQYFTKKYGAQFVKELSDPNAVKAFVKDELGKIPDESFRDAIGVSKRDIMLSLDATPEIAQADAVTLVEDLRKLTGLSEGFNPQAARILEEMRVEPELKAESLPVIDRFADIAYDIEAQRAKVASKIVSDTIESTLPKVEEMVAKEESKMIKGWMNLYENTIGGKGVDIAYEPAKKALAIEDEINGLKSQISKLESDYIGKQVEIGITPEPKAFTTQKEFAQARSGISSIVEEQKTIKDAIYQTKGKLAELTDQHKVALKELDEANTISNTWRLENQQYKEGLKQYIEPIWKEAEDFLAKSLGKKVTPAMKTAKKEVAATTKELTEGQTFGQYLYDREYDLADRRTWWALQEFKVKKAYDAVRDRIDNLWREKRAAPFIEMGKKYVRRWGLLQPLKTQESVRDAASAINNTTEKDLFGTYLRYRNYIGRIKYGGKSGKPIRKLPEKGINPENVRQKLDELVGTIKNAPDNLWKRIIYSETKFRKWRDSHLDEAVKKGIYTQEQVNILKDTNWFPHYFEDLVGNKTRILPSGRFNFKNLYERLIKYRGDDREIIRDPFEAMSRYDLQMRIDFMKDDFQRAVLKDYGHFGIKPPGEWIEWTGNFFGKPEGKQDSYIEQLWSSEIMKEMKNLEKFNLTGLRTKVVADSVSNEAMKEFRNKSTMWLPKQIADVMADTMTEGGKEFLHPLVRDAVQQWKIFATLGGGSTFQTNNLFGDLQTMYRENAPSVLRVPGVAGRALKRDIWKYEDEGLNQAIDYGLNQGTWAIHDMQTLYKTEPQLWKFMSNYDKALRANPVMRLGDLIGKVSGEREFITRTALAEQYLADGLPKWKAYDLANTKLIDYASLDPWERKWMSGLLFPFYSFYKKNFTNTLSYIGHNPAKMAVKFGTPILATNLWNNLYFKNYEDNLSEYDKKQFHLFVPIYTDKGDPWCIKIHTPLNSFVDALREPLKTLQNLLSPLKMFYEFYVPEEPTSMFTRKGIMNPKLKGLEKKDLPPEDQKYYSWAKVFNTEPAYLRYIAENTFRPIKGMRQGTERYGVPNWVADGFTGLGMPVNAYIKKRGMNAPALSSKDMIEKSRNSDQVATALKGAFKSMIVHFIPEEGRIRNYADNLKLILPRVNDKDDLLQQWTVAMIKGDIKRADVLKQLFRYYGVKEQDVIKAKKSLKGTIKQGQKTPEERVRKYKSIFPYQGEDEEGSEVTQ